jgi:hypothetical protein
LPFTVVRVEDPELTSDLERNGIQFKGETARIMDEEIITCSRKLTRKFEFASVLINKPWKN